jgi:hypothetical protein
MMLLYTTDEFAAMVQQALRVSIRIGRKEVPLDLAK